MAKKIEQKTLADLQTMHTGSLMSRRKALLACAEEAADSATAEQQSAQSIEFKNTAQWQRAYTELKQVLAKREHLPNKQERKAARQAAAKNRR